MSAMIKTVKKQKRNVLKNVNSWKQKCDSIVFIKVKTNKYYKLKSVIYMPQGNLVIQTF